MQLLYCFVWGLVYVDQGLLSSNGVTGTRSTDPSNAAVDAGSQGGLQVTCKTQLLGHLQLACHIIVQSPLETSRPASL